MRTLIFAVALTATAYAPIAIPAPQPITMELCNQVAKEIKKMLPLQVDAVSTRTGAKCEAGKTKPSMLVLFDSIDSQMTPDYWKTELKKEKVQAKQIKVICTAEGTEKLLPFVDIGQRISINGVLVGTISVTEKKCSAIR